MAHAPSAPSHVPLANTADLLANEAGTTNNAEEVSDWLQCRHRFQQAAETVAHYSIIWREDSIPESIADKVYEHHQAHIEAAHAWLRVTLSLLEKSEIDGEGGAVPFNISPTPETIALLSLALDHNHAYFRLLEKAVQMVLAYLEHEREILQAWSVEQTMKISEHATTGDYPRRFREDYAST